MSEKKIMAESLNEKKEKEKNGQRPRKARKKIRPKG